MPKQLFQLNCYVFYCCCYFVVVTVGSSHRRCSVNKCTLGNFADFTLFLNHWTRVLVRFSVFLFSNNLRHQGCIPKSFIWSFNYLARAQVMLLFSRAFHHPYCISQLPKDSFTSLFCLCYNWRWASDYTSISGINLTMLQWWIL